MDGNKLLLYLILHYDAIIVIVFGLIIVSIGLTINIKHKGKQCNKCGKDYPLYYEVGTACKVDGCEGKIELREWIDDSRSMRRIVIIFLIGLPVIVIGIMIGVGIYNGLERLSNLF